MTEQNKETEKQCDTYGVIASFLCGVGIENVDVVDLETAKYIKKLGFNKPTHWYWQDKTLTFVGVFQNKIIISSSPSVCNWSLSRKCLVRENGIEPLEVLDDGICNIY